jgi:4-amino-4-deoxy-L-arabinose transferase-like glycosyltransferase
MWKSLRNLAGEAQASGGFASSGRLARILLALALFASLVRFWRLGEWSLWYDEVLTWADLNDPALFERIGNPLGYRLVGLVVAWCGGADEWSLRLLPCLAGVACVPACFWALRPLAGEARSALAALFLACSSWHVHWSQTARFYTLAQLLALLGAGLYLRGLRRGALPGLLAGLVATASAGLFHPSAWLVLPGLALGPFVPGLAPVDKARRLRLVFGVAAALAACLAAPRALDAFEAYLSQKGQSDAFDSLRHYVLTSGFHISPVMLAAALVGACCAIARREREMLYAAAVVASVLLLAAGFSLGVRVSAQYVFVLLPWIALLCAAPAFPADGAPRGAEGAGRATAAWAVAWSAIVALPLCVQTGLYLTVRRGERPAWREAYAFVQAARAPGELVAGMEAAVGEHYLDRAAVDLRHPRHVAVLDRWRHDEVRGWARAGRPMWLVVNKEQLAAWPREDARRFERFLAEECRLVRAWPLEVESRDLTVWVYHRSG